MIVQAQEFPKQVVGHNDLRQLERDIATMRLTTSFAGIENFRFWLKPAVQASVGARQVYLQVRT